MTTDDEPAEVAGGDTTWLAAQPDAVRHVDDMASANPWISRKSRFLSDTWTIDLRHPANVATVMVDWSRVPEPLRTELKMAVWLMITHPVAARRAHVRTMANRAKAMVRIGAWMTFEGIPRIGRLDEDSGPDLLIAIAEWFLERRHAAPDEEPAWDFRSRTDGRGSQPGRAGRETKGLVTEVGVAIVELWKMAEQLRRFGVEPPTAHPFGGETATGIANDWRDAQARVVERLPDEVLVPLLAGAEWLLGRPAEDVIRLVRKVAERMRRGASESEAAEQALRTHRFWKPDGAQSPWHAKYLPLWRWPVQVFRGLVQLIRAAGLIVLLAETGVRPSEAVGLKGGRKKRTPLATKRSTVHRVSGMDAPERSDTMPACVSEELSKSALMVISRVHGHLFKQQREPRKADWLLGGRTDLGGDPPGFHAIDILERLHSPLRAFATEEASDLLTFAFDGRLDFDLKMVPITGSRFRTQLRSNIPRIVDLTRLPDTTARGQRLDRYRDSGGACIVAYQFRRTFAQNIFRLDARLLGPLARHMKHMSSAVTARAYVTSDPTLAAELEENRSRETALLFEEMMTGERRLAGTMGVQVERVFAKVRERAGGASPEEADAMAARTSASAHFRVFFADDNDCFIGLRPRAGLCNIASGRVDWKVDMPDLSMRDPDTCADCPNASYDRQRHGPRRLRAYVSNRRTWLQAEARGEALAYRAWRARAERDARILVQLGVPVPPDEQVVGRGPSEGGRA